jgi:hypothetical protein
MTAIRRARGRCRARTVAGLSLVKEHGLGHGAVDEAVNYGRPGSDGYPRLRAGPAPLPTPAWQEFRFADPAV